MLNKVKNCPGMRRDDKTRAIISIDNSALQAYKMRKKTAKNLDSVVQRVDKIENKLDQILQLLEGKNN